MVTIHLQITKVDVVLIFHIASYPVTNYAVELL